MAQIYTIGETVFDIIFKNMKPLDAKCGGAMLNTAISLGRLKLPVSFISEYADDKIGNTIDNFLTDNNINTEYIYKFNGTSPIALAFLDEQNNASYNFHRHYPKTRLDIQMPHIQAGDLFLFGSSFAFNMEVREKLVKLINQAKHAGALIMYDPNFRKAHEHELNQILPIIKENIAYADIIRASDEDMQAIFNVNTASDAYKQCSSLGCHYLIYTSAGETVNLITPSITKTYKVPEIKTISTIGAGDTFNAGVLFSMYALNTIQLNQLDKSNWNNLIQIAIACASNVCQSYENYISIELAENLKRMKTK